MAGCNRTFGKGGKVDSRSLLAGEALEEDLGVAVDAEVLNSARVGTVGGAVAALGDLAQQIARRP